jgi:hypothetical protein
MGHILQDIQVEVHVHRVAEAHQDILEVVFYLVVVVQNLDILVVVCYLAGMLVSFLRASTVAANSDRCFQTHFLQLILLVPKSLSSTFSNKKEC